MNSVYQTCENIVLFHHVCQKNGDPRPILIYSQKPKLLMRSNIKSNTWFFISAIFRSLTSDLDDITMTVGGGAKLQLVFGDITNETTDIVVNTTNFVDFHIGEFGFLNVSVFVSRSGWFPCKAICHVSGRRDTIEQLVCNIISYCENYGYKSVAIPAIYFTLPLYWDSMTHGEAFKVVALQPSSAEYKSVKEGFKRTVSKTVMKIERLQNVHLRKSYEVQKKQISDNRRHKGGAREKLLYHGTTRNNCDSIMKTGFNRSFAGQNGTSCGHGTYFAVHASYSAQPTFSKPAADGSQLLFVARVLTGVSTRGSSDMKVPLPRGRRQSHDRCDSVVDRIDNPSMYVVFHDNQAYPDYLITFK
uniref:Poly [ADP-ribose] polymerase n=1 Tax=Sparus aurata TaxID=8175 RepID=A0A671W3Q5_SPAAU